MLPPRRLFPSTREPQPVWLRATAVREWLRSLQRFPARRHISRLTRRLTPSTRFSLHSPSSSFPCSPLVRPRAARTIRFSWRLTPARRRLIKTSSTPWSGQRSHLNRTAARPLNAVHCACLAGWNVRRLLSTASKCNRRRSSDQRPLSFVKRLSRARTTRCHQWPTSRTPAYHFLYGKNLPFIVTITRSPLGSSFFCTSSSKSMALMMPSPNISWMIALSVVP